ncbi:cobyric acid synthase [Candidatus Spongiisocius sp.]|uniref:cobyric acid synthase n=1 Tax=Candidatus Spongiisocius sp. TaxID=3101273 RepID=UPI003B59C629
MRAIMIQGTASSAGKSLIVAGLCRLAARRGISVSPFKPQNMSNNAAACPGGGEIGRAQALQARAAGVPASPDLNPVLIKPQSDRTAQLVVRGEPYGLLEPGDYIGDRGGLLDLVLDSFNGLVATHDLVIVEGAGSPAETNLRCRDIANMGFARRAGVPVCIVGDIDRGGVIASLVGTHAVLDAADAAMVAGFIINKFRGARSIFEPGVELIERRTGWRCLGVVPWIAAASRLPSEDAVALPESVGPAARSHGDPRPLRVAVPLLGRIANHDDLDPLLAEPGVECQLVRPGRSIPRDVDVILLPGTKSTIGDLDFCRQQGWDHDIIAHARGGGRVFGICGGMQMLGQVVHDPNGVDGPARSVAGFGLLDIETTMADTKIVREAAGRCALSGSPVHGYEIHNGRVTGPDLDRPLLHITHGPDGVQSPNGRVGGVHLHGIFASDEYRRAWLARLGVAADPDLDIEAMVEEALDGVASALEAALDVDELFNASPAPLGRKR